MAIIKTEINGLFLIRWPVYDDSRGFFKQTYQAGELSKVLGRNVQLYQGNHSRSRAGVLRGFHLEPWDKLVYVPRGHIKFVVVDPRRGGGTFGRHVSFELGDAPGSRDRVFVSKGLANAFYCYTEADYINDVSEEFDPAGRLGFNWNDSELGISWPNPEPILSEVDLALPEFRSVV